MATLLLKKSYQLSNLKEVNFNDLWGSRGVFTTMRMVGKPPKLILLKPHIENLIKSTKKYGIRKKNLKSIIKGDQKIPEISAASIIAKVSRDRLVSKMSKKFKKYLWDKNSGYGTKDHIQAIKKFGITKHHRRTFQPVHNILSLR